MNSVPPPHPDPAAQPSHPELVVAGGVRIQEADWLAAVDRALAPIRRSPELMSRPVRVVVPSRSLRDHLASVVVRGSVPAKGTRLGSGRPRLGLALQTHTAMAVEVLDRAGERSGRGDWLLPALVRAAARGEALLRERLGDWTDGYSLVEESVRDLLDAGFQPALADAFEERLSQTGALDWGLARAVVRVAIRVCGEMAERNIGHRSSRLRRAAELLAERGHAVLPAREVFVVGYAETTGVVGDLLETLVRSLRARVWLNEPSVLGPETRGSKGYDRRFTARLRERIEGAAPVRALPAEVEPTAEIGAIEAPGASAEVRAVGLRIRRLLSRGAIPEQIGLVARDVGPYRLALRHHLDRLAVPFSAHGVLAPGGSGRRRVEAVLELLRDGEHASCDRWLDALIALPGAGAPLTVTRRGNLRFEFRSRGFARLREICRVARDTKHRPALAASVLRAADMFARIWGGWPAAASFDRHLDQLGALLREALGWPASEAAPRTAGEILEGLRGEVPPDLVLARDDFLRIVRRALESVGLEPLGGNGGGVQVLNVMEARTRSFEHLFVLGLNREIFPRSAREDPLLRDPMRAAIRDLLPDFPLKNDWRAEENHLFGELLGASRCLTLSWQRCDDDGRALMPSTWVEQLRANVHDFSIESVGADGLDSQPEADLPALEVAIAAGASSARDAEKILRFEVAFEERSELVDESRLSLDPQKLCRARLALLSELDADPSSVIRLGPQSGFVGAVGSAEDPRHAVPSVTLLERLARCPWRTFVQDLLKVSPVPDPLAALPAADMRSLGNVVHRALEWIVGESVAGGATSFGEMGDANSVEVPWPGDARARGILRRAVASILAEEGQIHEGQRGLPGLAELIEELSWPALARARELEWPEADSVLSVLGVEVPGEVEVRDVEGRARRVSFRADRVDRIGSEPVITDYKTGRPVSDAVRERTRRQHHLLGVRRGERLQVAAYAHAVGKGGGEGRYLFLRPEASEEVCRVVARAEDPEFVAAFEGTVSVLLDAIDRGSFAPRLLPQQGGAQGPGCEQCAVAEACSRGDAGARGRLANWLDALDRGRGASLPETGPNAAAERAFVKVWELGA